MNTFATYVYLHYGVVSLLASSNRLVGRIPLTNNSHDNTDQPKATGPLPVIPSPIPPTPMESVNNVQQHPFPSAAYSHQTNANSSSGLTTDYAKSGSSYSQRNPKMLPNDTGGPSLAEEILSSLRSNNKRPDGLPATML